MPAIRKTFLNKIYIKMSAKGLQIDDFCVKKETAVENGF